jgi:predicted nucleic acid-binding protein
VPESKIAVVDASVVLKWQFDDEDCVSQAVELRDDYYIQKTISLIAPQLFTYEVVNGVATASRRKRLSQDIAFQTIENLAVFNIELREIDPLSVLKIALQYNLAAYDAAYLVLAEDEDCDLWTGDRAFYQAVKGKTPHVRWIGDYSGNYL